MGVFRKILVLLLILPLAALLFAGSGSAAPAERFAAPQNIESPKYVFLIIGDGMGQGHLRLGSVYEKILFGDQDFEPVWERFTTKRDVAGREESASGGTALACGEVTQPSVIGRDSEGVELVTILDLACERGMSTAIATNAAITDATPAAFSAHAADRKDFDDIAIDIASSGVDIMLGSGMGYLMQESDRTAQNKTDAAGFDVTFKASGSYLDLYASNGYRVFSGLQGAEDFSSIETLPGKFIGVFCNGNLPFQGTRLQEKWEPLMHIAPTLVDFAERGIESLQRDDDGFVFVIEQAQIDKACQAGKLDLAAMEMEILNRVLDAVFDFYYEHPDETLIILTADHETGDLSWDDGRITEFEQFGGIPWDEGLDAAYSVLHDEWEINCSRSLLRDGLEYASDSHWLAYEDNMAWAAWAALVPACDKLGIKQRDNDHSEQQVPLYAIGAGSEKFAACESNHEVPLVLCDIMGWPMLPMPVAGQD